MCEVWEQGGGWSWALLPLAGGDGVLPAALVKRDEGKRNFFPLLSSGFQRGKEAGLGEDGVSQNE